MQPKIFIIAGEASGDLIGANLIKSLKQLSPDCLIFGVGGNRMIAEGLDSIFQIEEISLIGYSEVLPKIFRIKKLFNKTYEEILKVMPDIIVTIDSPGFNLRLIKRVRKHLGSKIKIVNYVAPSIWAYKPKRIYKIKELYNHQLLILPIEKPYFDAINFPSTFVGHPILEEPLKQSFSKRLPSKSILDSKPYRAENRSISDIPENSSTEAASQSEIELEKKFKQEVYMKYNIQPGNKLITVMPGSRRGELKKHMPILLAALNLLKERGENFSTFVPTLPHLEDILEQEFRNISPIISSNPIIKNELLFASDIALIKSGTSSLELIRYNLPMIVTYKVSSLTAFILRFFITTKYFALPNIILNERVVPELIQDKCTAQNIADELFQLLNSQEKQTYQKERFNLILERFRVDDFEKPSTIAAKKIVELL